MQLSASACSTKQMLKRLFFRSDPLESTLLDGRCIKRWSQLVLDRLWSSATSGGTPSFASDLAAANTLVLVAEALAQPSQEGQETARSALANWSCRDPQLSWQAAGQLGA